jgi:hypothetical protein
MKAWLSILMVLVMSIAVRAAPLLERLPRPEDMTYGEQVMDLLKWLFVLAFLSPVGWAVIIALIIAFCSWTKKSVTTLATTDFKVIPEIEKRDRLLKELEREV